MSYGDLVNVTTTGSWTVNDIWSSSGNITFGPEVERVDPDHCAVCGGTAEVFFCELCRQAILDLRKQTIRRMARELLEMGE